MTTPTMKDEFEAGFVLRFLWSKKGRSAIVRLAPNKLVAVVIKDFVQEELRRSSSR